MTIEHPGRENKNIEFGVVSDDEDVVAEYNSGNDQYYVVDGEIDHYGKAVYIVRETDSGLVTHEILGRP